MKNIGQRLQSCCLCIAMTILLAGCSNTTTLPWEDAPLLDPGNIRTQAPLQVPPDLDVLPPIRSKKEIEEEKAKARQRIKEQEREIRLPWEYPISAQKFRLRSNRHKSQSEHALPRNAPGLPFPAVEDMEGPPLTRNDREQLPSWMKGGAFADDIGGRP